MEERGDFWARAEGKQGVTGCGVCGQICRILRRRNDEEGEESKMRMADRDGRPEREMIIEPSEGRKGLLGGEARMQRREKELF